MQSFSDFLDGLTSGFTPVIGGDFKQEDYTYIDLSENNPDLLKLEVASSAAFSIFIDEFLKNRHAKAAYGGYIKGPGGPRDDKIPTLLSNTEFVQTGKAVAGADPTGQNNPDRGAKTMMGIMRAFEQKADQNARAMA